MVGGDGRPKEARWLLEMKEEGSKMKEREGKRGCIYKGGKDYYNIAIANPYKRDLRLHQKGLRPHS